MQNLKIFWALLALIPGLLLVGCDATLYSTGARAEQPSVGQYLQMANQSQAPKSTEYRLRAADLLLQQGETATAQHAIRQAYAETPRNEDKLRQILLEVRMALLKQNSATAREGVRSALSLLGASSNTAGFSNSTQIALLLPSKGPHFDSARIIRDGFFAAYYKNGQDKSSQPTIKIYDTGNGDGGNVQIAYNQAIADHSSLIVGPLTKQEVQAISGIRSQVPVLALNTITDNGKLPGNIYQFGLIPEDEVASITEQARRQKHMRAMIIAVDNEWGQRIVSAFKQSWHSKGGTIVDTLLIKSNQDISQKVRAFLNLQHEQRHQADMIFLATPNELAREIKPNLNHLQTGNLPIYATAAIYAQGTPSPSRDQELNGVRFCDMPWILTSTQSGAKSHSRFYALGIDAYQLAANLSNQNRLSSTGVSGTTGDLYWNERQQRIQRNLICYRFESGIPVQD